MIVKRITQRIIRAVLVGTIICIILVSYFSDLHAQTPANHNNSGTARVHSQQSNRVATRNNFLTQLVASRQSPVRPVDKFITIYGQKIHYVEAGRGSVVILIHGLGADLSQWNNLIAPLSQNYHVIALDQIGHGQSDRPFINYRINTLVDFLEGFYKAMKIERASLVGESLGGATATAFALAYPQQVERLVLVDAGYGYAIPEASDPRLLGHQPGTLHLLGPSTRAQAKQLLELVTHNKQTLASEAAVDELFASTMRAGYTIQKFIESFARREDVLDNRLQALNLPTLIVWGRQDILSPLALGERFNREIANSQMVVIDNCGHAPPNECPREFNLAVIRFLDGTNAKRRAAIARPTYLTRSY